VCAESNIAARIRSSEKYGFQLLVVEVIALLATFSA
jgi:hypothetical protein